MSEIACPTCFGTGLDTSVEVDEIKNPLCQTCRGQGNVGYVDECEKCACCVAELRELAAQLKDSILSQERSKRCPTCGHLLVARRFNT